MFETFTRRRRRRRVRPGDGSALRPLRPWQILTRTQFSLELAGQGQTPDARSPSAGSRVYTVDVHYLADELEDQTSTDEQTGAPPVALYRDGVQVHAANPPVAFPVPGGSIEVATSLYGLTRMHHVPDDGPARTLAPHPWSLEGLRARFGRRFPRLSAAIGVLAVIILLAGLVALVPQLAELVTQLDVVAERVGTFTSPISLPDWANMGLLVGGALAATERALTLRNHWLIDADTTWAAFS